MFLRVMVPNGMVRCETRIKNGGISEFIVQPSHAHTPFISDFCSHLYVSVITQIVPVPKAMPCTK